MGVSDELSSGERQFGEMVSTSGPDDSLVSTRGFSFLFSPPCLHKAKHFSVS
jgi:hypothetical protein